MGSSERSSSSKEAWHEVADRRPGRCPAGRWIVARRRGADTVESHRSGLHGAARPRSHGDAGVGHGGRRVLQRPGVPGEDRSPRQDRAVAGRALARDRPEELHLLPQAGVRFHNGRELKAADVKFVIERAMNPETKHPYPQYYASIGDITVK